MKLRTTTILLTLSLFTAFTAIAQSKGAFRGTITYKVTYPDNDARQVASMPQTVTLKLNGNKTRAELNTGEMNQILLLDSEAKSTTILVNINGHKAAIKPKQGNERNMGKEPIVEPANESKEIAGYVAKKAIIHYGDERSKTSPIVVYYSDEIGNNKVFYDNEYRNLPGIPLEFNYKMQGMNMLLTATKVESGKVSNREFEVPSDYKEMTPEEIRQMFGGGK